MDVVLKNAHANQQDDNISPFNPFGSHMINMKQKPQQVSSWTQKSEMFFLDLGSG